MLFPFLLACLSVLCMFISSQALLQGTVLQTRNVTTWKLQWADEFNGNSVDESKWSLETGGGWGNHQLQYYKKENALIAGGFLNLVLKKEDYGGAQYTSARLKTQGKFSTMYGKIEIRAKLPGGQGIWPQFFLLGDSITQVGWPACGEIMAMEYVGRNPDHIFGSLHAAGFDKVVTHNGGGFTAVFKIYSIIWTPSQIEFYVDGKKYATIAKASTSTYAKWPFSENKFFLVLAAAIGGNFPGNPDASTRFPQQFSIDYIRVYQASD